MSRLFEDDFVLAVLRYRLQSSSQVELARELGISASYLNDVLRGRREPGEKILKALKLRRVVSYERVR